MLKGCQAASSALRKCDGNIDVPGPRRPVGSPNAAWPHFPKLPFGSCRIELGQPIPLIAMKLTSQNLSTPTGLGPKGSTCPCTSVEASLDVDE